MMPLSAFQVYHHLQSYDLDDSPFKAETPPPNKQQY